MVQSQFSPAEVDIKLYFVATPERTFASPDQSGFGIPFFICTSWVCQGFTELPTVQDTAYPTLEVYLPFENGDTMSPCRTQKMGLQSLLGILITLRSIEMTLDLYCCLALMTLAGRKTYGHG